MSESKRDCPICARVPGEPHDRACPRHQLSLRRFVAEHYARTYGESMPETPFRSYRQLLDAAERARLEKREPAA